jgi:hypothetical protein
MDPPVGQAVPDAASDVRHSLTYIAPMAHGDLHRLTLPHLLRHLHPDATWSRRYFNFVRSRAGSPTWAIRCLTKTRHSTASCAWRCSSTSTDTSGCSARWNAS